MKHWPLAWRLFRRELFGGQLKLITAALALAVLAVTSLGLISERLKQGLLSEATQFLAADRVLVSPQPVDETLLQQARDLGLETAQTLSFQSMLFTDTGLQLVSVQAVSDGYPLRGQIDPLLPLPGLLPAAGALWIDGRLHNQLANGEQVELGNSELEITGAFARLPDGGFNVFASAPTVLMRLDDVEATGVVQPGSRLTWRYQFAGSATALKAFEDQLLPTLTTSQRWQDVRNQETPLARAIQRAEQFMLLATLFGIALACAAVGVAARRYCQRHYDVVAMLKTLGASHRQVRGIFALHLGLTTLLGIALGLASGLLMAQGLIWALPETLRDTLAPTQLWRPVALGCTTGLVAAIGFTLYPMLRLMSVPPLRVLRRDIEPAHLGMGLNAALSIVALASLAWLYSGSWVMTWILLAGAGLLTLLLAAVAWGMLSWGRTLGMRTGSPLQLALAGLRRRANDNVLQLVGFSVALMLLLTVLALRQDLLQDWQSQLPEGTPDHFLVNIAPDQTEAMDAFLAERNVVATDLYPVVRGRLSAINGETVQRRVTKEDPEPEGPRGIGRELNLTYRIELPPNNPIEAGQWYSPDATDEVSVELEVAERLGIGLGDTLSFTVEGQTFTARVTSLRKVNWETMQPNFFMIFPPETLAPFASTYIASFLHPEGQPDLVPQMAQRFPTVSVLDVGTMIEQLRQVVDQVAAALGFVLLVVLAASSLLLFAQTEAGMASRRQELAIMRTLGASGSLLKRAVSWEFALLGALAGILAVAVAELVLFLVKTQLFQLVVQPHWNWWWSIPLGGALLIGVLGRWACRRLLHNRCAALLASG
ncbi:ABC transporter permease [Ferrimonas marina]|uniref:Putative ABC transport system permease protein n=1 Tax=Ferrimonas marina TaxID=299255 RepID=A0A1M5SH71_9GAMM|nr:FtsX-like permease family protein [Ferrimonas marina]SHH37815.1 putative ABC transport system permease protein [Ferrimonas marina]